MFGSQNPRPTDIRTETDRCGLSLPDVSRQWLFSAGSTGNIPPHHRPSIVQLRSVPPSPRHASLPLTGRRSFPHCTVHIHTLHTYINMHIIDAQCTYTHTRYTHICMYYFKFRSRRDSFSLESERSHPHTPTVTLTCSLLAHTCTNDSRKKKT